MYVCGGVSLDVCVCLCAGVLDLAAYESMCGACVYPEVYVAVGGGVVGV